MIRLLQQAEPTCSIQIFSLPSITLREWLDDGRLDAAIVTRAPDSEEGHWLTSDIGVWISSPDYAFDGSKPVPLALFQTDCKYHAAAVNGLTKQGTPYQLLACSNTASAQRAIVKAGLAIGAMGKLSVTSDLKILDDMPPLPSVDIVLILASKHHPVLDKEVLNQLVELESD